MNGTTVVTSAPVNSVSDLTWRIVAVGDLNADGKADLVWRNAVTGENVFWLMNDAAYVTYVRFLNVSDTTWEIAGASDLSGDGKTDII